MSDSIAHFPSAFEANLTKQHHQQQHHQQHHQQLQGLDFFSFHSPSDILAPHPDLFESELDSSLAAFDDLQFQLLTVDSNDAYSYLRSDTPTCGPPSTITISSESAYDSLSSHSESFYNPSTPYTPSNCQFPHELEMDFQRIAVDNVPDYAGVAAAQGLSSSLAAATVDPTSFGTLPPTPPRSPHVSVPSNATYIHRRSYSDYGGVSHNVTNSSASDYYAFAGLTQSTVSPASVSPQLPLVSESPTLMRSARLSEDDSKDSDPKKKYRCSSCPRAFARAYNLKTHMATHDPNRLKPHVCPHRTCGRSFSRKHDLGRHLVSIHQDESVVSSHHSASTKKSIGVDKATRGWCEACGKGWVGKELDCDCHDVK